MRDKDKATGTEQYAAFMGRVLRTYGRRAAAGEVDVTALEQLADLQRLLDEQVAVTVHALRTEQGGAHSWAQIGRALGMHRAAAAKKFGATPDDARVVGGQPAHLR